jgi:hypothetical protein
MANVLKHVFVSPKTDGADATLVQPSNWNDGHKFEGGALGNVLIRDTGDASYGAAWSDISTVINTYYGSGFTAAAIGSGNLAAARMPVGAVSWSLASLTISAAPLSVTGFGSHNFTAGGTSGNLVRVRNTTAGAANWASIHLGNDAFADVGSLYALSSTYGASSGPYQPNALVVNADQSGGLSLSATNASGIMRFYTGGVAERGRITSAGVVEWSALGLHKFAAAGTGENSLGVRNSATGSGNYAAIRMGNDTTDSLGAMFVLASNYTTSGDFRADGFTIRSAGAGGMDITCAHASGILRLNTVATERLRIEANGDVFSEGIRANTSASAANTFIDSSTGEIFRSTSSRRYKQNEAVITVKQAADVIHSLNGWTYESRKNQNRHAGLMAEEAALACSLLAGYDAEGLPEDVQLPAVMAHLIPYVKHLEDRIAYLEGRVH